MIGYGVDILLFCVITYQFYRIDSLQQSLGAVLMYIKQRDDVTDMEIIEKVVEEEMTEKVKEMFKDD